MFTAGVLLFLCPGGGHGVKIGEKGGSVRIREFLAEHVDARLGRGSVAKFDFREWINWDRCVGCVFLFLVNVSLLV